MLNVTDLLFARGSGITLLCFHMIIVFSDNGVKINTTISLQPISFVTPLSIFKKKKKKLNKPFFKNNNNTIDCGYVLVVNILQQYFHSTNDDFLCLFIFCMMFFHKIC